MVFDIEPFNFKKKKFFEKFDDLFPEIFSEIKSSWLDEKNFARFPLIDLIDEGASLKIVAELPGVDKNDIKLDVSNNSVSLSAEHKQEAENKGKSFYRKERSLQKFFRSFSLPAEVLPSKVKTSFKNGVLEVSLPKKHPEHKKDFVRVKID